MTALEFFLLNEDGSYILLETGGRVILENVKTDQTLPFKIIDAEAQGQLNY